MRLLMFVTVLFVGCYVQNQPTGESKIGDHKEGSDRTERNEVENDVGIFIGRIEAVNPNYAMDKEVFRVHISYNNKTEELEVKVGTGDTWDSTDCYTKFTAPIGKEKIKFGKKMSSGKMFANGGDVTVEFAPHNSSIGGTLLKYDTGKHEEFRRYTGYNNNDVFKAFEVKLPSKRPPGFVVYRARAPSRYDPEGVGELLRQPVKSDVDKIIQNYFKDQSKECEGSSSGEASPIYRPEGRPPAHSY